MFGGGNLCFGFRQTRPRHSLIHNLEGDEYVRFVLVLALGSGTRFPGEAILNSTLTILVVMLGAGRRFRGFRIGSSWFIRVVGRFPSAWVFCRLVSNAFSMLLLLSCLDVVCPSAGIPVLITCTTLFDNLYTPFVCRHIDAFAGSNNFLCSQLSWFDRMFASSLIPA